jgi:hypothetical protein
MPRRPIALLSCLMLAGATTRAAAQAESDLAAVIRTALAQDMSGDWATLDKLPHVRWAAPAPTALQNCLPDGGCYARQGAATLAGRNLTVIATGARTILTHLYVRNQGAPIGEQAVLAALRTGGATATLARCPASGTTGGTNWYRLAGDATNPGVLAVQSSCAGRPCEGFVLSLGADLPPLQPNQVRLYSEQCGTGAERAPVAAGKPHELLAGAVVALLVPVTGPALYDWKTLTELPAGIQWAEPRAADPASRPGSAEFATRRFSANASGTAAAVRVIQLEENGLHPRGEHLLGVVYEKGIVVQLVRCGPVYTESTNNWYRLTSPRTRPAMIRQSIRYDGNQVQDSYELRLDGSLPPRDPRDRDPGVGGCR